MRKFNTLFIVLVAFLPACAWAFGLGQIKLTSHLNQRLNAEISILSLDPKSIKDIRIALASSESFKKAQVQRSIVLTRLKFKAILNKKGKPVVEVTTKDPLKEPFLNFLVEVNWPRGRMLREYTLLLDPPVTIKRSKPAPIKVAKARKRVRKSGPPSVSTPSYKSIARGGGSGSGVKSGKYKVGRSDTLWKVAKKVMPSDGSSTTYQSMMALYQANPGAFDNNNINNLKRGAILRIPDQDAFTSMTHRQAVKAYKTQVAQWREQKGQKASSAQARPQTARKQQRSASTAPVKENGHLKLTTVVDKTLKGSANEALPGYKEKAELKEARNEFLLIREQVETQKTENADLKQRTTDLEQQLNKMKRLISLKDEQLAALQAQDLSQINEQTTAKDESQDQKNQQADAVMGATEMAALEAIDTQVTEDEGWEDSTSDTWGDDESTQNNDTSTEDTTSDETSTKADEVWADEEEEDDEGMMAMVNEAISFATDNAMIMGGAFGGIIVLFIVIRLIGRRKSKDEYDEDDEDFDADMVLEARREAEEDLVMSSQMQTESVASAGDDNTFFGSNDMNVEVDDFQSKQADDEEIDIPDFDDIGAAGNTVVDNHQALDAQTISSEEMDFDLDLDGLDLGADQEPQQKQNDNMDIDLSGSEPGADETVFQASSAQSQESEQLDFDLDLDGLSIDEEKTSLADEFGDLNLDQEDSLTIGDSGADQITMVDADDEVETKLDLARAYIDMGDGSGAKEILDEVVREGNASQKQQAEALLKQT